MTTQQSLFPDVVPTVNPAADLPLTADLRVLVQMSDGRYGIYGWDGIGTAGQLREHLAEAGWVFSDRQVCDTEPAMPASVAAVFADPQTKPWGQP